MVELKENLKNNRMMRNGRFAIVFSIIAFFISLLSILAFTPNNKISDKNNYIGVFQEIKKHKVLKIGYGGFPPYTIVNPNVKNSEDEVTGYSIDLIKEIASLAQPELEIEWVRFSWETIQTELNSGKFDIIADPVYQTIPRAFEFDFTMPYAYFGIAVGVVNKDDDRFNTFSDLDRDDIIISLAKGWTTSEYAEKYLDKPKFHFISATGDAFNQLDDVILGRADVALNDVPTVVQYVNAHSDVVKSVFIENPPSSVPGGFVVRKGEVDLLNFLNTSLYILMANGTLERLDEKWETYHHIPINTKVPGSGIK